MKKLLLFLIVFCPLLSWGQNRVSVTSTPPLGTSKTGDQGVSGHYAGWLNGKLWTMGGCNFPELSCADGGQKFFYPSAYGASVQVADGVVVMGGTDGLASIQKCSLKPSFGADYVDLPALPKGLDNFAATYHNGVIYVAGGQSNGVPNSDVYSLAYPVTDTIWTHLATMSDACRLQPCLAVQNTAKGYSLFIFGGYQPRIDSLELSAVVHTDGLCHICTTHSWHNLATAITPSCATNLCGEASSSTSQKAITRKQSP